jgi:hypothetical protein
MPINKQTYHRLIPLMLLIAISMAVLAAGAEDKATGPGSVNTPSEIPVQTSPEPGDAEPEPADAAEMEAVEKASTESTAAPRPIRPFKPTEKIQADSAVSFPIDI